MGGWICTHLINVLFIFLTDKFKSFYSLKLKAVSVGRNNTFYSTANSILGGKANIIIDSGTTLTLLPVDLYHNFAKAISNSINLQRTDDPNQFLEYCFETTTDDYKVPFIAMHFEGANLRLQRENVLIRVSDNVICLAFAGAQDNDISIYGNIAQINFLVGYDVTNMSLSFKPMNCVAM